MKELYLNLKLGKPSDSEPIPFSLEDLYSRCEALVKDFRKDEDDKDKKKRLLIIVEDLTNFLQPKSPADFPVSERLVTQFILKLKALSILNQDDVSISIAALTHSPDPASEHPDLSRFSNLMSQTLLPSVAFEVSPLSTGFSSQITGYVKVVSNPNPSQASKPKVSLTESPSSRTYHFKLENNAVRVIPL